MNEHVPLRVGVIGLGMMGRNHARVVHELPGVELVGVADPAGDVHSIARGAEIFETPRDLIDFGIDAAIVAAPTGDHLEVGLALADAGVHALIEKPLAETSPAAQQLRDAFAAAGLVGAVGHIERFNAALQELKHRLAHGQAGEIFQIATRRVGPFPARIRDVGVVKDLATHDIDMTAWIADSPYAHVQARAAHMTGRKHEDLVAVTGQLENGVITNHLVNWLSPLKDRSVTVTGTLGAFVADTLTGDLTWFANADVPTEWSQMSVLRGVAEGDMVKYAFPRPEPLKTEHSAFFDAIRGLDPSVGIVTMDEGLRVVEVAEAVLASAKAEGS